MSKVREDLGYGPSDKETSGKIREQFQKQEEQTKTIQRLKNFLDDARSKGYSSESILSSRNAEGILRNHFNREYLGLDMRHTDWVAEFASRYRIAKDKTKQ